MGGVAVSLQAIAAAMVLIVAGRADGLPISRLGDAVSWQSLGPNRGGRVTTVTGVRQFPLRFYAGTVGGGILRTDDAGTSWRNISTKAFGSASVGSIAVAPANPDILYAGMGESTFRTYMSSAGDGVYKSVDGGESWTHQGLAGTRRIGSIAVDPRNSKRLFVAAMGDPWTSSAERGVYRSTDGGRSWARVLFVNATTSALSLALDPRDPDIVYASTWDNLRSPWYLRSGGPGSGIFKSSDGGQSWRRLSSGLPAAMGKVGLAISPADGKRLYAVVEASAKDGGLYRSSDGGEHWVQVNRSRELWTRPWYFMHVIAHPTRRDTLFVASVDLMRSDDGGKSFAPVAVPHDDNHALWLNPDNPAMMVQGSDGGASVSMNGGASWSSLFNQRTGQFYRVSVDNSVPYYILGSQQDWGSIALRSRDDLGGTAGASAFDVGGGEAGYVEADPFDPAIIYAGSELGYITRFDRRSGISTPINPQPLFPEGQDPRELRLRFNVDAPIVASMHTSGTVYFAGQVVLRSRDRGDHWTTISPDLTKNEPARQGKGAGPFTNERINAYNSISALAESPRSPNLLWAGTDDGTIQVTSDGGATWHDVTPARLRDGLVYTLAASAHDSREALAAVQCDRLGDQRPHIFRTVDSGAHWTDIAAGLPQQATARAVREDPVRPGLFFAGTDQGVYFSADAGGEWAELSPTLPTTPVTGIAVSGNDLVISTEGSGLWSFRGLDTLRQWAGPPKTAWLYRPGTAYVAEGIPAAGLGLDAPDPVFPALDLWIPPGAMPTSVSLEIVAADGGIVRHLASFRNGHRPAAPAHSVDDGDASGEAQVPATLKPGFNRIDWDLRHDDAPVRIDGARDGQLAGHHALPGTYIVRMVADGSVQEQRFELRRAPAQGQAQSSDYKRKEALLGRIEMLFDDIAAEANRAEKEKSDLLRSREPGARRREAELDEWETQLFSRRLDTSNDRVNFGGGLIYDVGTLYQFVDSAQSPIGGPPGETFDALVERWNRLKSAHP